MNKKMLDIPQLFKKVKSNDYHVSLRVEDFNAMKENNDLESYVNNQLYAMIYKDLITTINDNEEVIVPRINDLKCIPEPHPYDPRIKVSIIVDYFQFLIRVDESVLEALKPVSFSIRGVSGNYNGDVGEVITRMRAHQGKRPDKIVTHEPDMERESPKICGKDDGSPREKPQHWRKY